MLNKNLRFNKNETEAKMENPTLNFKNRKLKVKEKRGHFLHRLFCQENFFNICGTTNLEHPYRSVISIKLQSNFIEITLRHGCCPVNLLHIFRTPFPKNTSGWLLLAMVFFVN